MSTPDGLRFVYLERGAGKRKATAEDYVEFVVSGWYLDGHEAGQTFARDRRLETRVRSAPSNADRILVHLVEGDHVRLWIPPGLGREPRRGPVDVHMVAELQLLRIH
jgi:FKBP-type peptidyl-prolyl cis-trans isomerase